MKNLGDCIKTKRNIFTILAFAVVVAAASLYFPSSITSAAPTPIECFEVDDSHVLLWYYGVDENCPSDVEIPTTVWFIGELAFYGTAVTSVTFSEYTLGIGQEAFAATTSLTSVDFSNNIDSIGASAFEGSALESVTIPDSVVQIGNKAFASNNLTSVTLGSGLSVLGDYIFLQNHLTDITLPSTMTTIPAGMFYANDFTSLTIPSTVTTIGNYAFSNNELTDLTIPNSVTTIREGAFNGNELTSVALPNSVISIGANAFSRNTLTGVSLGEGVTTIGSNAFSYNSITDVVMPDSVMNIGQDSFGFQSAINKDMHFLTPANQVQALYDQIWYVRLYTQDVTNPHGLTDSIVYEQSALLSDADGDGTNDSVGGHIINPALVMLNYEDTDGAPVSYVEVLTGTGLNTYKVVENVGNDLTRYYRQGTNLSIDAQSIDGYEQPDSYTMLLASGVNQYSFLYAPLTPPTEPPVIDTPQTPPSDESGDEDETVTTRDALIARESTTNPAATEQVQEEPVDSTEPTVVDTSTEDEGQPPLTTEATGEQSSMYPWVLIILIVVAGLLIVIVIARRLRKRQ